MDLCTGAYACLQAAGCDGVQVGAQLAMADPAGYAAVKADWNRAFSASVIRLSATAGLRKLTIIPSENRRRQHCRVEQAYQITAALGVKCGKHGTPNVSKNSRANRNQYFFQSRSLLSVT